MDAVSLSSYLASRIFHDLASPLQALMSGGSAIWEDDSGMMRAQGEKLLREGLDGMSARIKFLREALGQNPHAVGAADARHAKSLFDILFSTTKAELDWRVGEAGLSQKQMQLLMNMALLALETVVRGGVVRLSTQIVGGETIIEARAIAHDVKFTEETLGALEGREPSRGWHGKAIQPYFTRMLADGIGYAITSVHEPGAAALVARGPAGAGD